MTASMRLTQPDNHDFEIDSADEPSAANIDAFVQDFKKVEQIQKTIELEVPSEKSFHVRKKKEWEKLSGAKSVVSKISELGRSRKSFYRKQPQQTVLQFDLDEVAKSPVLMTERKIEEKEGEKYSMVNDLIYRLRIKKEMQIKKKLENQRLLDEKYSQQERAFNNTVLRSKGQITTDSNGKLIKVKSQKSVVLPAITHPQFQDPDQKVDEKKPLKNKINKIKQSSSAKKTTKNEEIQQLKEEDLSFSETNLINKSLTKEGTVTEVEDQVSFRLNQRLTSIGKGVIFTVKGRNEEEEKIINLLPTTQLATPLEKEVIQSKRNSSHEQLESVQELIPKKVGKFGERNKSFDKIQVFKNYQNELRSLRSSTPLMNKTSLGDSAVQMTSLPFLPVPQTKREATVRFKDMTVTVIETEKSPVLAKYTGQPMGRRPFMSKMEHSMLNKSLSFINVGGR